MHNRACRDNDDVIGLSSITPATWVQTPFSELGEGRGEERPIKLSIV